MKPIVLKKGYSAENKVAGMNVSTHRFWVVAGRSRQYRIDIGVNALTFSGVYSVTIINSRELVKTGRFRWNSATAEREAFGVCTSFIEKLEGVK